jgi:hypothetical protein
VRVDKTEGLSLRQRKNTCNGVSLDVGGKCDMLI